MVIAAKLRSEGRAHGASPARPTRKATKNGGRALKPPTCAPLPNACEEGGRKTLSPCNPRHGAHLRGECVCFLPASFAVAGALAKVR